MTTTGASLDAASTLITTAHWAVAGSAVNGTVAFTYSTGNDLPATGTIIADGITNPSSAAAYWVTVGTYTGAAASGVCTGTLTDTAVTGFNIVTGTTLSLTVNQTLSFSVNAVTTSGYCGNGTSTMHPTVTSTPTTIPFGTVIVGTNGVVCQLLTAATNATNGYTVFVRDNNAPINAIGQSIAGIAAPYSAPAVFPAVAAQGAYGYTTSDTAEGANLFATGSLYANMTQTNEPVGIQASGTSSSSYTVTHQVGVSTTTQPGTYSNTIIYTCTPIY